MQEHRDHELCGVPATPDVNNPVGSQTRAKLSRAVAAAFLGGVPTARHLEVLPYDLWGQRRCFPGGLGRSCTGCDPNYTSILSLANGVINFGSSTKISAITDGTSNTFLMAERNFHLIEPKTAQSVWYFWFSGAYSDTMFTTLYPSIHQGDPVRAAAERQHPGRRQCHRGIRRQQPSRRRQFCVL